MKEIRLMDYPCRHQIKLSTDNDILVGIQAFKNNVTIFGHCGGKTKNFYCIKTDGEAVVH